MPTVKAAIIRATGRPEVFRYESISLGDPGADEVLIRHTAIGVNFIDTYFRSGLYPTPLPAVVGNEAVGVVEAIGSPDCGLRPGDRVAYATGQLGGYAEAALVKTSQVVPVPAALGDDVVAGSLLRGMTVEYLLKRLYPVKPGETIVVHAAAGSLGLIACQWARHLGARIIGTVSSREKAAVAREHGCDHVVIHGAAVLADEVRRFTAGAMVGVVYDSIGRDTFMHSLDCLRPRGMLVSFGNASGKPDPFDIMELAKRGSLFVTRPSLYSYTSTRAELLASAGAYFEVLTKGVVTPHVGKVFALADAAQAHDYLEDRNRIGSPILRP